MNKTTAAAISATKHATSRKVAIVGAGDVGASFAFSLAQSGLADTIAIIDVNVEMAEGQALDMAHGLPYMQPVDIYAGGAEDYADASVIVITAGAKQRPGETRLNLLERNALIVTSIMDDITRHNSEAIVIIVTNPVDILTYIALKHSKLPKNRVFGSGTVLDSARFRYLLSRQCGVDVRNVHAYILGEHGDSEFAAWSMCHVAGMQIDHYCSICGKTCSWEETRQKIVSQVRDTAYHLIDAKGSTSYGIALALIRIVGAVLRDEHSVLTVSSLLEESAHGVDDICLSVPCIVSSDGVERNIFGRLTSDETQLLKKSAAVLRSTLDALHDKVDF